MIKKILMLLFLLAGMTIFAQNPFVTRVYNDYKGVFISKDIKLRAYAEGGIISGNVFFKNKKYALRADVKNNVLKGIFTNGTKKWPFTMKKHGSDYVFRAGSSKYLLKKLPQVQLPGAWRGKDIKIVIENINGKAYKGSIHFDGGNYVFFAIFGKTGLYGNFSSSGQFHTFKILQGFKKGTIEFISGDYEKILEGPDKAARPMKNGEYWAVAGLDMRFIYISSGTFKMGSDDGDSDERPVHKVTISNGYWIGKYEVTQKEYQIITNKNPSRFKGIDKPVEQVSWNEAVKFCQALTKRESKAKRLPQGYEYRLPTEAEWEFAARGGIKSRNYKYSGSNKISQVAWYDNDSDQKTHKVGKKSPNELGIHDMSGNVWEWCFDQYGQYESKARIDPIGAGSVHVNRGGSWYFSSNYCRVTNRDKILLDNTYGNLGFRVVLAPIIR